MYGVSIDPAASVKVQFTASIRGTGETLTYQTLGSGRRETIKVPVEEATVKLTITDAKGRSWTNSISMKTQGHFVERGDVKKRLAESLRGSIRSMVSGGSIPRHIYPSADADSLGKSTLTLRGEF